jgi:hypothetical protein
LRREPWDFPALVPYADEFLSGFVAETYQVALAEGFEHAKGLMQPMIQRTICQQIGGNHQRVHSTNVDYRDITFKHLLLPVWISAYQFEGKIFRFLVNARTGEVQGERPWSWVKIVMLIAAIVMVIAIVTAIAASR